MPEYIKRTLEQEILTMAKAYPVVTVTGCRQSGKTTLLRRLFSDKPYYNLEAPDILQWIKSDPRRFLRENSQGAIIDEIQKYPELTSYLQSFVDEQDRVGQFFLSGSENLTLSQTITQTLAGRTATLVLYPLSIEELRFTLHDDFNVNDYLYSGFYPRIYKRDLNPTVMYRDYVQTYLERDVRQITQIQDLSLFQKFLVLCAGRVGQIVNYNALANEVGVSNNTIKQWLSILEASYVIKLLQPYYNNINKRVIKSPKLYFTDTGLASFLLGIHTSEQMSRDPLRGALFENLVFMEFVKVFMGRGKIPPFYFYRDNNQNEVDMIIKMQNNGLPIEIKAAETFNQQFLKGLMYFNKISNQSEQGYLIYAGKELFSTAQGYRIRNFKNIYKIYEENVESL